MGFYFSIIHSGMLDSTSYFHTYKGCKMIQQNSPFLVRSHDISRCVRHSFYFKCSSNLQSQLLSYGINCSTSNCFSVSRNIFVRNSLLTSSVCGRRGLFFSDHRPVHWARSQIYASIDVAGAIDVINDLGLDTLTLLVVTVIVVPAFKIIKASPILGFFLAGVILNQFGLIRNLTDVKVLSEWGILFLLFEMGLELSFARLKALAKFAFGMGLTQV